MLISYPAREEILKLFREKKQFVLKTSKVPQSISEPNLLGVKSDQSYRICSRCIMDTTDPEITFDQNGICNHCDQYERLVLDKVFVGRDGAERLEKIVTDIKATGRDKQYDCIIGVSGGVDSSYVAYLVKKLGLRALAVHFDNGWDSELAVRNIERALKKLDIDLHTVVMDWEEFKDIQLSFLKASVENAEIPTDHAIMACLFQTAAEKGIRYIISGSNIVTEAILPASWSYDFADWRFLKAIHQRYGERPIRALPHFTILQLSWFLLVKKLKIFCILDYVPYVKEEAMKVLQNELGWQYYGGKHYESIYTRFFQGYILPKKFGYDKRRAHLSTLVCSSQIQRKQALEEMNKDPYPNSEMLREDLEYVVKKLDLTRSEFEAIMASPIKTYRDYPSNHFMMHNARRVVRYIRNLLAPIRSRD